MGWLKCSKIRLGMVVQFCKYTKIHLIIHLKWVNYVRFKIYLNKTRKKWIEWYEWEKQCGSWVLSAQWIHRCVARAMSDVHICKMTSKTVAQPSPTTGKCSCSTSRLQRCCDSLLLVWLYWLRLLIFCHLLTNKAWTSVFFSCLFRRQYWGFGHSYLLSPLDYQHSSLAEPSTHLTQP